MSGRDSAAGFAPGDVPPADVTLHRGALLLVGAVALGACSEPLPEWSPAELRTLASLTSSGAAQDSGALAPSPANPYSDDGTAARLGRALFFDEHLGQGAVSCATCHVPERSFSDGRVVALGVDGGLRNTPTLLGAAALRFFGWEGGADSLWAQNLLALEAPSEHAATAESVLSRVQSAHSEAYESVFDEPPGDAERVLVHVAQALEAYVRTLRVGPAPFDEYVAALLAGDPRGGGHLPPPALRGLAGFLREGCVDCHHGPWLTDGEFHNLGLPSNVGTFDRDPGRQRGVQRAKASPHRCRECPETDYLNAGFEDFAGAFKTPTLRNVQRTAPYMHTGQFRTLEEVVEFYRKLPGAAAIGRRDPQLRPLPRSVATRDLTSFLRTLTAPLQEVDVPPRTRPETNVASSSGAPARSERIRPGTSGAAHAPSRP